MHRVNWKHSQRINICACYITSTLCMLPRYGLWEPNRWQTSRRCFYAPNKCFLQLIAYEVWCSSHHSAIKFFVFWCNMNGKAYTNWVHIDWHSTAISDCKKNGDQTTFGTLLIPQIAQHKGVEGNALFNIYYVNLTCNTLRTSLFWTTLSSFIHLYSF